jgi:hypothetical protein
LLLKTVSHRRLSSILLSLVLPVLLLLMYMLLRARVDGSFRHATRKEPAHPPQLSMPKDPEGKKGPSKRPRAFLTMPQFPREAIYLYQPPPPPPPTPPTRLLVVVRQLLVLVLRLKRNKSSLLLVLVLRQQRRRSRTPLITLRPQRKRTP